MKKILSFHFSLMTTQYNERLMKNPFRVLSQSVSISSVNFKEKSFIVFTEISLIPLLPGLTKVALNVGRNCLLPNEENSLGRITVNDIESNYYRKELQVFTHRGQIFLHIVFILAKYYFAIIKNAIKLERST